MENLKVQRMKAGLRQIDVARLIGISENMVSKIETGRVLVDEDTRKALENIFEFASKVEDVEAKKDSE